MFAGGLFLGEVDPVDGRYARVELVRLERALRRRARSERVGARALRHSRILSSRVPLSVGRRQPA